MMCGVEKRNVEVCGICSCSGNFFLTLGFEVGASNEKSCLRRSVNVSCADSSRLNLEAGVEHIKQQLVHT